MQLAASGRISISMSATLSPSGQAVMLRHVRESHSTRSCRRSERAAEELLKCLRRHGSSTDIETPGMSCFHISTQTSTSDNWCYILFVPRPSVSISHHHMVDISRRMLHVRRAFCTASMRVEVTSARTSKFQHH